MASSTQAGSFTLLADSDQRSMTTFVGYLVTAGAVNALIAAFLLCRLPTSPASSVSSLTVRALIYVSISALAGMAGARYYWNRSSVPFTSDPPLSFRRFALANAAGWVWVPAVLLLSSQDSLAAPAIAILAAALLATGLRKTIAPTSGPFHRNSHGSSFEERELFADSLSTPPREVHAYVIAICIYAAGFALQQYETLFASGLLALCAFICAWKLTLPRVSRLDNRKASKHAALRLARVALIAVLTTLFALLFGIDRHNRANAALRAGDQSSDSSQKTKPQNPASGISGYESVILWPNPPKKQIIAPLPPLISPFDRLRSKPMVIRFDGAYWYFQPPGKQPGPHAHQAHGSPLSVHIQANNLFPLIMEAHQSLASSIRLARCRGIEVNIQNRNDQPGAVALAIFLGDSSAPGKPPLYLGQQPVMSSEPGQFSVKHFPADEKLRFAIPERSSIRKFDEITILFLPDAEQFEVGPKIAIQDFDLLPR